LEHNDALYKQMHQQATTNTNNARRTFLLDSCCWLSTHCLTKSDSVPFAPEKGSRRLVCIMCRYAPQTGFVSPSAWFL